MKRTASAYVLALLLVLPAGVAGAQDVMDDFTITSIDGKTIDSRSLRGTPMMINVMATWCGPCGREAQELQKAYLSYKDRGVVFLGIFVRSGDDEIRKFVEAHHITFPVGKDNGIARGLRATAIPTTVFISGDGRIVRRVFGPVDYSRIVLGLEQIIKQ
jgi:peroxiredoxin